MGIAVAYSAERANTGISGRWSWPRRTTARRRTARRRARRWRCRGSHAAAGGELRGAGRVRSAGRSRSGSISRVACCDRWAAAVPDRVALIRRRRERRDAPDHLRRIEARSDRLAHALRSRGRRPRATAWRCSCRSRSRRRSAISPPTSSAPSPCRSPPCSDPMRFATGCRIPGPRRSSPTPPASRSSPAFGGDLPDLETILCIDGPIGRRSKDSRRRSSRSTSRFRADRTRPRTIRR